MDAKTFKYVIGGMLAFGVVGFTCLIGLAFMIPVEQGSQPIPTPTTIEVAWVNSPQGRAAMWPTPMANAGEPFYVFSGNRVEVLARVANEHGKFTLIRAFGRTGYIESGLLVDIEPTPTSTPSPTATRPAYRQPASRPETVDIDIVDWTWYLSESGNYIYVDGVIKNVSARAMRLVEVHVELLDKSGRLLAVDSAYASPSSLGPGQRSNFKVMTANRQGLHFVSISNVTWRWAD